MNGVTQSDKCPMKLPAFILAVAMMLTVLVGSGAITTTVAAASPEAELELVPHYRDVTYVLDPVSFNQRFDAMGTWEEIGDADLADSRLVMNENEGASLALEDNLANYFESRLMFNSTAALVTLKLSDGSNFTSIAVANTGKVTATYSNGSDASVEIASGASAGEWIKVGIEFTDDAVIFSATGADGSVLGSATVTDALLAYGEITEISIKTTETGSAGYADYVYGSLTRTSYTPAELNSLDMNSSPSVEEKFQKMKVEFGDRDMAPGIYSDEAATYSLYGGELSDRQFSADRYLNQSDMGEMLSAHRESINPVTGTATYKGWSDLQEDNENTLLAYLADQHDVTKDQVTVIDYYMDGVSLNYTFNEEMCEAIENAWFQYAREMADDLGAQTAYVDDASVAAASGTMALSITKKSVDLDHFYYPATVDAKKFDDAMGDLSDRLREKTLGAALMVPESFENITAAAKTNPSAYYAMDTTNGGVWNNMMKELDRAYQFTDAALGNVLQGATYMLFDLGAMGEQMSWSVMENGKLTDSPFTVASLYGTEVVAYGALIVLIAIPLVACLLIFGVVKVRKVRRSQ